MNIVVCNQCNWCYFEVTRKYAKDSITAFNKYFNSLTKKQQKDYYKGEKSSIKDYERCHCGNKYKNFRDAKPDEYSIGSTLNPIITRED